MKVIDKELINSKYVTVDEKGWHISDDAPDELKKKFNDFIENAKNGIEIELI